MFALSNSAFMDMTIDGRALPARPNVLEQVQIIENISTVLPTINLTLNDADNHFSNEFALSDGNLISVVIGSDIAALSNKKRSNFRLFSDSNTPKSTGFKYKLNGLFDCPKFSLEKTPEAYDNNSSEVLIKLANTCRLQYDVDSTVDSQVWLNLADSRLGFARKMAKHSYSGAQGLMALALTDANVLLYKDLIRALKGKPVAVIASVPKAGQIALKNVQFSNNSGFFNSWLNYGFSVVEPTLAGEINTHNKISLSTSDNYVAINKGVSDSLESVRVEYTPLDCGNTHTNYWAAYHSNIRKMGLFSRRALALTNEVTDLRVTDCVDLQSYDAANDSSDTRNGKYIVVAKKKIIKGLKYAEIFELLRPTVGVSGNTSLLG